MAAAEARGTRRCRIALAGAGVWLLVVSGALGCGYENREPGLFGRDDATPPSRLPNDRNFPAPSPLPSGNPSLPVVGESTWTSADGLDVQVRIAVHAVRRVAGGTVLDWSLTPISAANLRPGDSVPESLDLGLTRDGRTSAVLIDFESRSVYRPLSDASDGPCLCTPIEFVQRRLRVGVTTLLQTAYPEVPAGRRTVDVSIATVPPFWRVPITPAGRVPLADRPTDLTRPADGEVADMSRAEPSKMFRYGEQVFRVAAVRVVASSTFTSVEWVIVSITGGDGVDRASTPPFARTGATTSAAANPVAASGPRLRPNGSDAVFQARLVTDRLQSATADECLCTDLRGWAAVLRRPDKVATVVTNYPALPPGTSRAEVLFAGLAPIEVLVTAAPDAARRTADSAPATSRFWPSRRGVPRPGWEPREWPTPVPTRAGLERSVAVVDRLLR
jgi:hypothetical protein